MANEYRMDLLSPVQKPRRVCCTSRCCCYFLLFLIPILIILGVGVALIIYYCYPRPVSGNSEIKNIRPTLSLQQDMAINIVMDLYLTINNTNYLSIGMSDLDLEIYYWCSSCYSGQIPNSQPNAPDDGSADIGNVHSNSIINFSARSITTSDPITVTLYGSKLSPVDYQHLLDDCSAIGSQEIALHIYGTTYSYLNGHRIPYTVRINKTTKSHCCIGVGCSSSNSPSTSTQPSSQTSSSLPSSEF
ncbi:hypothetical protein AKO1_002625 [Acrasis kona]|uniref:Late embryogenesis abundant protein LEA-2 subgroup domain-containing protein n=1 Tax=Acrasis kona TaxID=1008807 RepID=A0AAW2ZMA8_9EUKA